MMLVKGTLNVTDRPKICCAHFFRIRSHDDFKDRLLEIFFPVLWLALSLFSAGFYFSSASLCSSAMVCLRPWLISTCGA